MTIDAALCKAMILHVATCIHSKVELRNEADSLGDSDHDSGMETGFKAVAKKLSQEQHADLGSLFSLSDWPS
jgi:hypothetical protein